MKTLSWQPYNALRHAGIPEDLRNWLLDNGSFMNRLRKHGILQPKIQVLSQRWGYPTLEESKLLHIRPRQYALIREVLISENAYVWMFARTVIPRLTLTGDERRLAHLRTRALGSVLFKNPACERGAFELICLQAGMEWHEKIKQHVAIDTERLWARRSRFDINQKSLLLTEVFLPAMATLK